MDKEARKLLRKELKRQEETIELIASENYASPAVMEATGSIFTNKYSEGYPDKRYYGGCANMDAVEMLAIRRAKKLFNVDHVNVQPHSGTQANLACYAAAMEPGDVILSMDLSEGGHLSHGSDRNFSGQTYKAYHYSLDPKTEQIDYDRVNDLAEKVKPRVIVAGFSAYSKEIDFQRFNIIAKDNGAYLLADIAHVAGLVAAGVYNSPVGYADFITTTTHKTLRGPRGAMIMCDRSLANAVDKAVFPGQQGGPFMHSILAKAVAFEEASTGWFQNYQSETVENAQLLSKLLQEDGFNIVSGGTDCHMFLINLEKSSGCDLTGIQAQNLLEQAGIAVNKNLVPGDRQPASTCSGIRIGTPAVTCRGFGIDEVEKLAELLSTILKFNYSCIDRKPSTVIRSVRQKVRSMCKKFPIYKGNSKS